MRQRKLPYVFSFIFILFIGLSEPVLAQQTGKTQQGAATWYGSRYHGRKTTSGEVYNKNHMTAAHPTLPFGTKVKVTHSATSKAVIVRINDRGPFKGGYMHQSGSARVRVEVVTGVDADSDIAEIPTPPLVTPDSTLAAPQLTYFVLQAGSFADQTNARQQSEKLKAIKQGLPVSLKEEVVKGRKVHRVVGGHFNNRAEAEQLKAELEKQGILVLIKQLPVAS
jgi:rare lipoprotein A